MCGICAGLGGTDEVLNVVLGLKKLEYMDLLDKKIMAIF